MRLIFNELSGNVPAGSLHEGRECMDCFVRAVATLADGSAVELIAVRDWDFFGMELSAGYRVAHWSNDRQTDRDTKVFFRRITTKTGFPQDVDEAAKDRFYLASFFLTGGVASGDHENEARGLGMASVLEELAVSMPSEKLWQETHIRLRHVWYQLDGTVSELGVTVLNVSRPDQVRTVSDENLARTQSRFREHTHQSAMAVREGFPHLGFGSDVDTQMAKLPSAILQRAFSKLIVLDTAVRNWRRNLDQTRPELPKHSKESQPTMQKFGHLRSFRDSTGETKFFEDHVWVGRNYRIHCSSHRKDEIPGDRVSR